MNNLTKKTMTTFIWKKSRCFTQLLHLAS